MAPSNIEYGINVSVVVRLALSFIDFDAHDLLVKCDGTHVGRRLSHIIPRVNHNFLLHHLVIVIYCVLVSAR